MFCTVKNEMIIIFHLYISHTKLVGVMTVMVYGCEGGGWQQTVVESHFVILRKYTKQKGKWDLSLIDELDPFFLMILSLKLNMKF